MEDSSVAERERQSDQDVWRTFTKDVAPLAGRAPKRPMRAPATPAPVAKPVRPASQRVAPAPAPAIKPALPELMPGAAPGVDRRTAERLRRGEIAIDLTLDLHGYTLVEAHRALALAVERAAAAGERCILVITGHGERSGGGRGALRDALPRWLNESSLRPRVLAVQPAQPKHGGRGAFYVLLKRKREHLGGRAGEDR
jgi:DNA-nicking Smr family endonuclease